MNRSQKSEIRRQERAKAMYAFVAGASLAGWIMIGHSLLVHFGLTGMPFCVKCTFAAFTVSEVLYLRNAAEALAIARR